MILLGNQALATWLTSESTTGIGIIQTQAFFYVSMAAYQKPSTYIAVKTHFLTCKKTCSMAVGFPPPNFDIRSIVSRTRIKKGSAKQSRRCHGLPAVKAFCKHKIHRNMYEIIVSHLKTPLKQNTLAVTNGMAPRKKRKEVGKKKFDWTAHSLINVKTLS